MATLAHILIISPKADLGLELAKFIEASNFECCATTSCEDAAYLAKTNNIDIAILLSDETGTSPWYSVEDCKKLKSLDVGAPHHIIAVGGSDPKSDDISGWFAAPLHVERLIRRIQALLRLDTMEHELKRRIESMKQYKAEALAPTLPPATLNDVMILAIGAASKEFSEIEATIADENTMLVGAFTCHTALEYLLNEHKFDAVIMNVEPDGVNEKELVEFRDTLRRYPRLYNMPVIFLVNQETSEAYDEILSDATTELITKPYNTEDLRYTALSMAKEARFRRAMKSVYAEIRRSLTNDSLTGLYTHGFLRTHIERVVEASFQQDQAMSVAFFKIRDLERINNEHGYAVGDQILNQVGSMIGMLVRGEDIPARHGGSEFALVLPNTPPQSAHFVVDRIVGVIESTEFPSPHPDIPIRISLSSNITGLNVGDTGVSLLEKAKGAVAKAA